MATAMLGRRIAERGIRAQIRSGGWLEGGYPCPPEVARALADLDIDAPPHVSRELVPSDIEAADLILTMERRHVRHTVNEVPDAWPRTFTLKEFVRRAADAPRRPGEPMPDWVTRIGAGRTVTSMMGSSRDDDVEDPYGKSQKDYRRAAKELDRLSAQFIEFAWPPGTG
jgi:protein-tyrosine phosphatase